MNRPRAIRLALLVLPSIMIALGGCGGTRRLSDTLTGPSVVEIANLAQADASGFPLAVDVQATNGGVTLTVDPGLEAPAVFAMAGRAVPAWVAAEVALDSGRPVLRVLSRAPEGSPRTDLVIRVPSCAGARIRAVNGRVEVLGVSGALDIRSDLGALSGLAVTVDTASNLTDPVAIIASKGDIIARVGRGSAGVLTVRAGGGSARVETSQSVAKDVRSSRSEWTGTLNGGVQEMRIETDAGNATLRLLPDLAPNRLRALFPGG